MKADVRSAGRGVGFRGLVSLPTTQKPPPQPPKTARRSELVRSELGAFVPPARQARIARMRRSTGFAARMHGAFLRPGFRADSVVMVTATYRDGVEWEANHMSALMDHIRKWCKRAGIDCRYVWVGEVQTKRRQSEGGHCLHYHVALWIPFGHMLPKADAQGWWPHGSTRTELARSAVAYLMKYFSKGSGEMALPAKARMHGAGGLEFVARRAKRWLAMPSFVRARADIFDDWRAARGGGWSDPDGVIVPSEFQRVNVGGQWCCMRVADYGRPFEADGPFTWLHRRPQGEQK